MRITAPREARLDVLVSEAVSATRSQVSRWIAEGRCRINGVPAKKAGEAVRLGALIDIAIPEAVESTVEKQDIPIDILYQDADIAVINKPCGMVVHPAAGNENGTLVNALLFAMVDLSGVGGVKRPGIVHRLDKDTSGVLIVAKNDAAHLALSEQLKNREMEKHYWVVVEGEINEPNGRIDQPIGRSDRDRKKMAIRSDGREAQTEWTLLEPLKRASLLDVHILTGRTHQIRVHMRSIGHPVAGDPIYGLKHGVSVSRLMLHAKTIAFTHPRTGERLCFEAALPDDYALSLAKLQNGANVVAPQFSSR